MTEARPAESHSGLDPWGRAELPKAPSTEGLRLFRVVGLFDNRRLLHAALHGRAHEQPQAELRLGRVGGVHGSIGEELAVACDTHRELAGGELLDVDEESTRGRLAALNDDAPALLDLLAQKAHVRRVLCAVDA